MSDSTPPAPSGAETLLPRLQKAAMNIYLACDSGVADHVAGLFLEAAAALAVAAREPQLNAKWSPVQIRDRAEALANYVEEGEQDRAVQMLYAYADQLDAAQYARNKRQGEPQLGGSPSSTELVVAAREPQTWASMETAPKDGSWYLGWNEDCGCFVWRDGPGLMTGEDPAPTHWMPLPSQPVDPTGTDAMKRKLRKVSGKQAMRHAKWGHQIYKKLRWDAFTLLQEFFVDVPPKLKGSSR